MMPLRERQVSLPDLLTCSPFFEAPGRSARIREFKKYKCMLTVNMLKAIGNFIVCKCTVIPLMILLPFFIAYDIFCYIRLQLNFRNDLKSNQSRHLAKVRKIQAQIRQWKASGGKVPMCSARPGYKSITLQTLTYKERLHKIELDLPDILSLNTETRRVVVEPMITIGQLNDFLIAQGWTVPVVPELDDLTIGGLIMGGGIESTSHKYGLFHHTCRSYEMVLADGSVTTCSENNNEELFMAVPFTYGTLGFLTAVEIDIIPFKPFINLTYYPVHSLEEAVKIFRRESEEKFNDSVEGIMFSLNDGVIMSGNFIDSPDTNCKLNRIGRWYKPWFYKHVETFLNGQAETEVIPTYDFFHRHNKSYFWILSYVITFANHPVFRFLFGWAFPPRHALLKMLKETFIPKEDKEFENFVCQDFGVDMDHLRPMMEIIDRETKVYPLWLCPTRHMAPDHLRHLSAFNKEDMHIDVGVYGFTELKHYDKVKSQRRMERFVIDANGFVALYAETQLSREEFYEMLEFNMKLYDKLRQELKCEKAFPHVYEKISKLGRI